MSIQEEMKEFIKEISEEFELEEDDVLKYCFKQYNVDLDPSTNKNAIRWKISHGEFINYNDVNGRK